MGRDDADRAALQALREDARGYEHDRARILARIEAGTTPRAVRRRAAAPTRTAPRLSPVFVAGAVAATALGAAFMANQVGDVPDPAHVPTASGSVATGGTAVGTVSSPTDRPGPSGTGKRSAGAADTRSRAVAGGPVSTRRSTRTTTTTAPAVRAGVGSLPSSLVLPREGDRDWVVVGSRNDGKVVRAKAGTGTVDVAEVAAGSAAPVEAPLSVTWSQGIPEQDRTDNTRWWAAPAGRTVYRVTLEAVDQPSTLTLYAGGIEADVQVRAVLTGAAGDSTSTVAVPRTRTGSAVVITLGEGAVGGRVTVEIGATDWSPGGQVAIAAAVLR